MYKLYGYILNGDKFIKVLPPYEGTLGEIINSLFSNVTAMVLQKQGFTAWQGVTMSKLLVDEDGEPWVWDSVQVFPEPEAAVAYLFMANEPTVNSGVTKTNIQHGRMQKRQRREDAKYAEAFAQLAKQGHETDFNRAFHVFDKLSTKLQKE